VSKEIIALDSLWQEDIALKISYLCRVNLVCLFKMSHST